VRQVRGQVLPQILAEGGYTRLGRVPSLSMEGQSVAFGRADNCRLFAGAEQLLYSGGSVSAALRAAGAYRRLAEARSQQVRAELARDVRHAFQDLLVAEAAAAVRAQSVTQLVAWVQQVAARERQGRVPAFELESARTRLANEKPLQIQAAGAADVARARLRYLAHLPEGPFSLSGELGFAPYAVPLETLREEAWKRRPEVAAARERLTLARADMRATQGRYAPQVRARAGYEGLDPATGSSADEWTWGWSAGLTATWSLYDGGLREAEIEQKRIEEEQAAENLRDAERAIGLEIETLHALRCQAEAAVLATGEAETLSERSLQIAETRYRAGAGTYFDYTEAQQARRTARLARLEALAAHARAVASIECARGATVGPDGDAAGKKGE
jgi:outer membrane protein TolC